MGSRRITPKDIRDKIKKIRSDSSSMSNEEILNLNREILDFAKTLPKYE